MYVYIQSERPGWYPNATHPNKVYLTNSLWTVGFYDPTGQWIPESDYNSTKEAAERVAYLNGKSECRSCGLARSVSEALNSGNGTYKP